MSNELATNPANPNRKFMIRMQIFKKLSKINKNLRATTLSFSIFMILATLPWMWNIPSIREMQFLGLPVSYFYTLILMPCVLIAVLILATRIAEDIDRHTEEFENE